MSKALEIFKLLVILGPAIKDLWPLILDAYEAVRKLWEAAQKLLPASEQDTGILGIISDELDAEELEAEAAVIAAFSTGDAPAMFDLSKLRAIGKWAKANPKAAEVLIGVLTKLVPLFGG